MPRMFGLFGSFIERMSNVPTVLNEERPKTIQHALASIFGPVERSYNDKSSGPHSTYNGPCSKTRGLVGLYIFHEIENTVKSAQYEKTRYIS